VQTTLISNIFINFATGSYAYPTAMPPDRAKIIGLSRHRLSTDDYVLTRWKEIKAHIEALCRQLKLVKDYINECPRTFQMWGYVCFQREYGCQVILLSKILEL